MIFRIRETPSGIEPDARSSIAFPIGTVYAPFGAVMRLSRNVAAAYRPVGRP